MRSIAAAIVAFAALATVSQAHAEYDRRIRLINDTSRTIVEFHASNVGSDSWEEDILGRNTVAPGTATTINLNDGSGYCRFDFLTVLRDGQKVIKRNVNICEISSYRIYD
jgi:hypothetical protein